MRRPATLVGVAVILSGGTTILSGGTTPSVLPHSLVFDAEGVVVYHHVGAFGSTEQIRSTEQYLRVTL